MALLRAALGRSVDPQYGVVRFDGPGSLLGPDQVFIPGLRMGGGVTDLHLQRAGDDVAVTAAKGMPTLS